MERNNHQGWFGEAFIGVLAAAAGLQHAKPQPDLGIDLEVRRDDPDPSKDARIDFQIKTQRVPDPLSLGEGITVRLEAHQYRRLIGMRQVPAILIAVVVPQESADYTNASEQSLQLNHSAYWVSLAHDPHPLKEDQQRLNVTVPSKNLLTAAVIHELLDNGASGAAS
ncbi:DUF4365 domain-containing protein [Streptomyces sp. NPDC002506]|uniref:DUF4365 domain-containing protein n=1 Tax=Streptomyces sp. NPDC002506 TaxID=3154536 RepID=UPI00332E2647